MPLFFLIAIGAGAFSLGATTADVVADGQLGQTNHYAQPVPAQPQPQTALAPSFDASAYASTTDCLNAAALQGAPATACQK